MNRTGRFSFIAVLLVVVAWLWFPARASAHPADEYLQMAYLSVDTNQIAIKLDLTAGPLVAPNLITLLDQNSNGQIDEAEAQDYVEQVVGALELTIDGQPTTLHPGAVTMPEVLLLEAGAGTIRINLTAVAPSTSGTHEVVFRNTHHPVKSVYQASALLPPTESLTIDEIEHDTSQQTITIDYRVTAEAAGQSPSTATPDSTASTNTSAIAPLISALSGTEGGSWWTLLGLAMVLGGVHALTPGHGKTLVAAYLVGSRGTPFHAVLLGGVVTITHTASVFGIGLLVLLVGQTLAVESLTTALEVGAGVLVVMMGARLLWHRGRATLYGVPDATHSHDHTHPHDPYDPTHHHHDYSGRGGVGNLMMLGVSGGLIPCPEALGVMLVAISLGRVWQGLGLITAFSLGLAATIIALGLALVVAGNRVRGLGVLDRSWVRLLPLGSALVITIMGSAMTFRGLLTAFGVTI